jgi:hypothetical protein
MQQKYAAELVSLTNKIRNGDRIDFDEDTIHRLRLQRALVKQVSVARAMLALFYVLLPGIIFLLAGLLLLTVLKRL